MITCSVLSQKRTVSYTNLLFTKTKFKNYGNEADLCYARNQSMLRRMLYLLSRAVFEPVTHSSALTLRRREAERTYSSHKRRKTLLHALKPASSHPVPHRKRYVLTCSPPQAPSPLPKPLLLSAAARTATNARRRGGKAGRSQGVEPAKHKGQRERDVVSAMAYLVISIGEARRKSVGAKAPPTSTQWLASEEGVGYHRVTSQSHRNGVVARLKVVARRPALRPVHHAPLQKGELD